MIHYCLSFPTFVTSLSEYNFQQSPGAPSKLMRGLKVLQPTPTSPRGLASPAPLLWGVALSILRVPASLSSKTQKGKQKLLAPVRRYKLPVFEY